MGFILLNTHHDIKLLVNINEITCIEENTLGGGYQASILLKNEKCYAVKQSVEEIQLLISEEKL
jgi:uncharacterized protein YlzI (FlbEa/FlbD family)